MKNLIVFLFFIFSFDELSAQNWEWQNPLPHGNDYRDIFFIDEMNGWRVGEHGMIEFTSNGGVIWTSQNSNITVELYSVFFVNSLEGWIVGESNTILHTTNGGYNWVSQNTGNTHIFYDVHFIDSQNGWVVGTNGIILQTNDSGNTWDVKNDNMNYGLFSICFIDLQNGWTTGSGGKVLHTNDGGNTWGLQDTGTSNSLNSIWFIDSNIGWAIGGNGVILHTTDAGNNWNIQNSGISSTLNDIWVLDSNNAWIIGSGTVLSTHNGGNTWIVHNTGTTSLDYYSGICFTDLENGWGVGRDGLVLNTITGGNTLSFSDIDFIDSQNGWVVGENGNIFHTSNGGIDWEAQASGTSQLLFSVNFIDSQNGWIIGRNGVIRETNNAGESWISIDGSTTSDLQDVFFTDSQNGWIVGENGTILFTIDGGINWEPQNSGVADWLNSVYFINKNVGWITGSNGTILHTNNGGNNWVTQNSNSSVWLESTWFTDSQNGWAVGFGSILHTNNGGTTWNNQISNSTVSLKDIWFTSSQNGWIVGLNSILHTIDGGTTWNNQNSITSRWLNDLVFTDIENGWIAGSGGTILKYNPPPCNRTQDSLTLVTLYNATHENGVWVNEWNLNQPMDTWFGVQLSPEGCVECLDLDGVETCFYSGGNQIPGNNLRGQIPPEIGDLTQLRRLLLANNDLYGNLPATIGNLDSLRSLDISHNSLSGDLPTTITNLTNLFQIDLSYNGGVTGNIPSDIGDLSNLLTLQLDSNQISGNIPISIGSLSNLEYLSLSQNDLTGSIPSTFSGLSKIVFIKLNQNQLDGEIPPELGSLSTLETLHARFNNLMGTLPPELGNLTNLTCIDFFSNQLEGCIPSSYEIFCPNGIEAYFGNNPNLSDFDAFCLNGTGGCNNCDLSAFVTVTNTSCGQPNGTATANVSGGSGNYTFLWSNGETTQTITDLEMGTYSVTVMDGDCEVVVSGIVSFEEEPVIEWERSYGGEAADFGYSLEKTFDGGFFLVGATASNSGDVSGNYGVRDYWAVKINSVGELLWEKNFGGSGWEKLGDGIQSQDSSFLIVGASPSSDFDVSNNYGGDDCWIIKFNKDGELLWEKNFGGSSTDEANSIQQTKDGNFIIAGTSSSNNIDVSGNYGNRDFWIFKIDKDGELLWENNFGGSGFDSANSIQETQDEGYIIVGSSQSNNFDLSMNNGGADYWIIRLDKSGELLWENNLGGSNTDEANSVIETQDRGFIVAGTSSSTDFDVTKNHSGPDYWVVKLNLLGELEWERNFGGASGWDKAYFIQQASDGNYIVGGSSRSVDGDVGDNYGSDDYWLIKINENGDILWENNWGGSISDRMSSFQQTHEGGFILMGSSNSKDGDNSDNNGGGHDLWIVKLTQPHFPQTTLPNDTTLCLPDTLILTATDPLCPTCTYLWNDNNTDSVRTVIPTQTVTYSVTLTDENGCTATDTMFVFVDSITNVVTEVQCGDDFLLVDIDFDFGTLVDSFNIFANGLNTGKFAYDDLYVTFGPFMDLESPIDIEVVDTKSSNVCKATTTIVPPFCPPSSDDCMGIIDLGIAPICQNDIIYSNFGATESDIGNDNLPPCWNGAPERDIWFSFTTTVGIEDYDVSVIGCDNGDSTSIMNPEIALYRGDCGFDEMVLVECAGSNDGEINSNLSVSGLTPGIEYFIRVNDWSSTTDPNWGAFKLCVEEAADTLILSASTEEGLPGQEVCLDVFAENFNSILTMQYSMNFDPDILEFTEIQTLGVVNGLTPANFVIQPDNGSITMSWLDPNWPTNQDGISLNDSTVIYQVCFNGHTYSCGRNRPRCFI